MLKTVQEHQSYCEAGTAEKNLIYEGQQCHSEYRLGISVKKSIINVARKVESGRNRAPH